jgi:phthiodiolone/phenolphthiodiolone dimycocerosates ketoreductase
MAKSRSAIGLEMPCGPPLAVNRFYAYAARLAGLHSLWAFDHLQLFFPSVLWGPETSWTAGPNASPHNFFDFPALLGNLAPKAGRLQLGIGVTDPIRRHPVLIAQAMLSVAHMAKRPPILGLGTGLRLNLTPYGLETAHPVSRLEEAVHILRQCFHLQAPFDYHGRHYDLDHAVVGLAPPKGRVPKIWIAGNGPRMLALTGRYADGWLPALVASPEAHADGLAQVRTAAHEAGRDPEMITPSLWQSVLIVPTENEARALLQTTLGRTLSLVYSSGEDWSRLGLTHPFGREYRVTDLLPEQIDRATWERALAQLPPELLGCGFFWGTTQQVAEQLRAFGRAGLRHVVLTDFAPRLSRRALLATPWTMRRLARMV